MGTFAMISFESRNYYDLLEVQPDASSTEIRSAYLRAKAAYKKDSVALYTLMSESETEGLLKQIEEAFVVLSSPERRREYDRKHGILSFADEPPANVVSIDRVPPMEAGSSGDELLIAPATDFADDNTFFT